MPCRRGTEPLRAELEAAVAAAREAGRLLAEGFGGRRAVTYKRAADPVTEMDRRVERLLRERLCAAFPDYGFLGEEGQGDIAAPVRWIVDPLDGTANYAHGFPRFCTSIALEREGETLLGVIFDPLRDELFATCKGGGAFLNGQPIAVSPVTSLAEALVASGFPYDAWTSDRDNTREWRNVVKKVEAVRSTGSAALDLACVACGRFDAFWEYGLAPWDMAAGALLVIEAGGAVSAVDGTAFDPRKASILAAAPGLQAAMLEVLASGREAARQDSPPR